MNARSIQLPSTRLGAFRIAFICDPDLDADARCACRIISTLPGTDAHFVSINESSMPILLRELARLIRHRNDFDLLITAGRHASSIGKLWPDHWLDIGTTDHPGHVRPARVGLTIESGSTNRADVRDLLEISVDDRVIYAPGTVSYHSHFTAFHAASILHFADPRHRLLVEPTREIGWLESMALKMQQPRLLVSRSHHLPSADLARAADIALIAPGTNSPRVPIAQVIASKVPIVVARNRHTNWLDEIVERVDPPKPRLLVKAIMRLFENRIDEPKLVRARDWIERRFDPNRAALAWTSQLANLSGLNSADNRLRK